MTFTFTIPYRTDAHANLATHFLDGINANYNQFRDGQAYGNAPPNTLIISRDLARVAWIAAFDNAFGRNITWNRVMDYTNASTFVVTLLTSTYSFTKDIGNSPFSKVQAYATLLNSRFRPEFYNVFLRMLGINYTAQIDEPNFKLSDVYNGDLDGALSDLRVYDKRAQWELTIAHVNVFLGINDLAVTLTLLRKLCYVISIQGYNIEITPEMALATYTFNVRDLFPEGINYTILFQVLGESVYDRAVALNKKFWLDSYVPLGCPHRIAVGMEYWDTNTERLAFYLLGCLAHRYIKNSKTGQLKEKQFESEMSGKLQVLHARPDVDQGAVLDMYDLLPSYKTVARTGLVEAKKSYSRLIRDDDYVVEAIDQIVMVDDTVESLIAQLPSTARGRMSSIWEGKIREYRSDPNWLVLKGEFKGKVTDLLTKLRS